jgi:hypothetical protein
MNGCPAASGICLIVTVDDATSESSSAFFVEEEGTLSSFRGLREVIEAKGSSVPSIPIRAPTTGTPMRPGARSTRPG